MMQKAWMVISDDPTFDSCDPVFTIQSSAESYMGGVFGKDKRVCQLCIHTYPEGPVIDVFNIDIDKSEYGDFHATISRVANSDGGTDFICATPFIPGVQLTKLCNGRGTEYVCYMLEHEIKHAITTQMLPMIVTDMNPTHKRHLIRPQGKQADYINNFNLIDAIRYILIHAYGADSITLMSC